MGGQLGGKWEASQEANRPPPHPRQPRAEAGLSHWSRYSVVSQAHSVYSSGLSDIMPKIR